MIIFEEPFVSDELAQYAEDTQTPVLSNAFSQKLAQRFKLNLLDDAAFARGVAEGKRLYTMSENALDWVYSHITDQNLLAGIRLMKDKYATRAAIQSLYPDYFFRQVPAAELRNVDISAIKLPFILKPSVGFFSMGVYTITSPADWAAALDDIDRHMASWIDHYPASVLGDANFLLEEFIEGDEFAIDAYFDENGQAVILNIMKHDFQSAADVSDKLYYTSKEIIEARLAPFTAFLNSMNAFLKVRNFPAHIEVRVDPKNGRIVPIECNPLRFAGWCTTDLADFALNIKTYDYYLNNRRPDWNSILTNKDGLLFSFIILEKPKAPLNGKIFDFNALCARFSKVLHLRRMEEAAFPMFGLLFTQTPTANRAELDYIMQSDLTEFLK